jgi:DNA polymerase I-like protein with 3'-5' exonuclease and polymerase domains
VFDIPWIYYHTGILVTSVWDTKLVEAVILGTGVINTTGLKEQYSTSLLNCLNRRGIANLDKSVRGSFIGETGRLNAEQIKYAIDDVRYLEELYKAQCKDLNRLNLNEVANLENQVVEVTAHMKLSGIEFDKSAWMTIAEENKLLYKQCLEKLPPHINWNSPKQVKDFFGRKGVRIDSLSDIDQIKSDNPYLHLFKQVRKYYKMTTTYGESWLINKQKEPTVCDDNRIRCDFEQIISTGRFSCSNPNLQQIPKVGPYRQCFVARKGWTLCVGDFTGQELGIMAAAAGEQSWIDAMTNDKDVHSVMGQLLYGKVWDDAAESDCTFPYKCSCPKHKPLRTNAKNLNFGLAYGKGPAALSIDLNLSVNESIQLIRKYKSKIPAITRWLIRNGNEAVKNKSIRTLPPYNRLRNLELEPEEWRRQNQGKNTPVQGTGGDMLKLSLVYLYDYVRKNNLQDVVKIVLVVHDEIISEVKNNYAKKWQKIKKQLMEQAALDILKHPVVKTNPYLNTKWTEPNENHN